MRKHVAWLSVACALSLASEARAQVDAAAAERLFQEGRSLLTKGETASACAKFEESMRLDPAAGTLLNLAQCREAEGKLASAWGHFRELATMARRAHQVPRALHAEERVRALEPRLPHLTIVAPADAPKGLRVMRDGVAYSEATLGVSIPVNPGPLHLRAEAPGFEAVQEDSLSIREGESLTWTIPALPRSTVSSPPATNASGSTLRATGLVTAAAGGVVTAVGLGLGLSAMLSVEAAKRDHCVDTRCDAVGRSAMESADTRADLSTILTVVGVTALATGLVLWVLAPSNAARSARRAEVLWTW
jgi:hypothetical protein